MTTKPERKGKHITTACDQCRRMKIRCHPATPRCSNCERLNNECTYRRGPDKRKLSKIAVTQLIDRVVLLEDLLKKNNVPVPQSPLNCQEYLAKHSDLLTSASLSAPESYAYQEPGGQESGSSAVFSPGEIQTEEELNREKALIDAIDGPRRPGPSSDGELDQLSKRMGSLRVAEDGQLRYYGATSNMHILGRAATSPPQSSQFRFNKYNAPECLSRAGVGHYVSRDLEDHLIKLYLSWENPFIHVVDEDAFVNARRQALSVNHANSLSCCYNEVLVNAMCSIGAAFTDRVSLELPSPLSEFFATRARVLLDVDMDSPSVATVQALVIMSAHEAAYMRDARGWLYSGMALRLAVDLGLHLKVDDYVRSGTMSLQEEHSRIVTFWGTYVVDLGWSYYVGRIAMHIDEDGITVRKPSHQHTKHTGVWEYYTDEPTTDSFLAQPRSYSDTIDYILEHQVNLYSIMRRLQKIFNDKNTSSITALQQSTRAVTADLLEWRKALAPEISAESICQTNVSLPHTLLLHMQYHEVMIFANHPLIAGPSKSLMTGVRRRCAESARAIALIIQIYKQQWSLRRMNIQGVHVMFSAALVHLHVACTSDVDSVRQLAIGDLRVCCDALRDISRAFPSAIRALDSLVRIRQVWQSWLENPETTRDSKSAFLEQQSIPDTSRWLAIDDVIGQGSDSPESSRRNEDVSWLEGWMQMQAVTDGDPFSVAYA